VAKPKVFVSRAIPDAGLSKLRDVCTVDVWPERLPPARDVLIERTRGCDGLLSLLSDGPLDAAFYEAAGPQLKVVSQFAVGYNNIVVPDATRLGICVGNTPGVLTDSTADMAFALLISAARRFGEGGDDVRAGRWKTWEPTGYIGCDLAGKTVGVVGMGRIGAAFAKRCRFGWDMKVLYHNRKANPEAERELGARLVDFDTLLAESDFVSVHCDLNPSTKGLFNLAAFRKMKRTAVFVNTSRGPVHVTADLVTALKERIIFAAGLDVTDPEPPRYGDPTDANLELIALPNCIVQPHTASATFYSRNAMADIAADNLIAGVTGAPLRCWVNPEVAANRRK
jgi:glyoxylate reductase